MYIPDAAQKLMASAVAGCMLVTGGTLKPGKEISSGSIIDYAVEECIDADLNQRCTTPFKVNADQCYNIKWSTDGAVSHTTVEARDAGSHKIVFYRDTDGEWNPEKGELVYLDFKPKIWKTGNDTVEYTVSTC
ncbi:hypothetical protein BJ878DRAFT_533809 [Calycina marina]|uniref:CND01770-like protein n=1 Tax=Calycina marina TaxID=1763456 RepID=A0A9P8CFV9_9HELO|nr:hypothetical protein BJ878DRAFT_533809 [Calycina marina]